MKTPEEIKKGLECCARLDGCRDCPYHGDKCVITHTADVLALIHQLEAQVPKWISVKEQPEPPEDDVYYCYGYWLRSGRTQVETAEYLCGEWKIVNNFVLTHWMPLPEPPEEVHE